MRTERLVPCPPKDVWATLIQHAALTTRGAVLMLGGCDAGFAADITVYQSHKVLECVCGEDALRWELHARGKMTLVVFRVSRMHKSVHASADGMDVRGNASCRGVGKA